MATILELQQAIQAKDKEAHDRAAEAAREHLTLTDVERLPEQLQKLNEMQLDESDLYFKVYKFSEVTRRAVPWIEKTTARRVNGDWEVEIPECLGCD